MGKRDTAAGIIVRCARWLARRSERWNCLIGEVAGQLFLAEQMVLPAPARRFESADLSARAEDFNAAAELYFARFDDREHLLNKPFSDPLMFARTLFDLGVLARWLRLSPGETVAELGSGSCWLSHLLNRFGCKTIAIDVSPTALEMGRELFQRSNATRWELEPEFRVYDGHKLPLEDASVDKIVVYDAFHHLPNAEELLGEMARVLEDGGMVGMCEPGRRHAGEPHSQLEMDRSGVLENDIVVEELEQLALARGFSRLTLVAAGLPHTVEVPAHDLAAFMSGKGLWEYWRGFCTDLVDAHYILIYKGDQLPTSRRPQRLEARIEALPAVHALAVASGEPARLSLRLTNTGDTRWLAGIAGQLGWTRLGAQLYPAAERTAPIDLDWSRHALPRDVDPGETVSLAVELPPLAQPGDYRVVLDLVAEEVTWFARQGSRTLTLALRVDHE